MYDFTCAYNIGSLVNNFFGVKIFNPVPVFFLFRGFNFTLAAIVSSGSNFTFSLHSCGGIVVNHLQQSQELSSQVYLEHLSLSTDLLKDYHIELYIYLKAYHII